MILFQLSHLPPFAFSPYINSSFPGYPQSPLSKLETPLSHTETPINPNGHDNAEVEASSTIFIGNIHKDVHRSDLQRIFALYTLTLGDFRFTFTFIVPIL